MKKQVLTYLKPAKGWDSEQGSYTGTVLAVSSTVANGRLYVLMLNRSLVRGSAKPSDGYLELAASKVGETRWATVATLDDPERFGGSGWLSVIDSTAFLLKPGGTVYAISLASH